MATRLLPLVQVGKMLMTLNNLDLKTDDDARQAMRLTTNKIKDNIITLFLSSKKEMQDVISQARTAPVPFEAAPPQPRSFAEEYPPPSRPVR